MQIDAHLLSNPCYRKVVECLNKSATDKKTLIQILSIEEFKSNDYLQQKEIFSKKYGPNFICLFHGTNKISIEDIERNGFKIPSTPKMLGLGCYFAKDFGKAKNYCKGSQTVLFCYVHLGHSKEVLRPDSTLNHEKLISGGFDSVFAPANRFKKSKTDYLSYDEFVIYNPSQALPVFKLKFREWYSQ